MMAAITVLISPPGASFPDALKDMPQLAAKLLNLLLNSKFLFTSLFSLSFYLGSFYSILTPLSLRMSMAISLNLNFCILPLPVNGNSVTKKMYLGILYLAIWSLQ